MAGCTPSRPISPPRLPPPPSPPPPRPQPPPPPSPPPPKEPKGPHMLRVIMKEAENPSMNSLDDQIYSGVFLSKKTKKYWVERETMRNCFMILARGLSITWGEDPRYWTWLHVEETSDEEIEVALLLDVCWLEIHGKFETSYLTPGVIYEVVFVVMMPQHSSGWSAPVNLRLKLPDGNVQEHKESLKEKPREQWIELRVGAFMAKSYQAGEMEFSLFEYGDHWKQGLMVKSAIIRPKN